MIDAPKAHGHLVQTVFFGSFHLKPTIELTVLLNFVASNAKVEFVSCTHL